MSASSKDFEKIQREWYQKLKDEGFEDIENTKNPHRPLMKWHSRIFENRVEFPREKILASEEYYRRARELLHGFMFETNTHKRIWELHSDGWSKRHIESQIAGLEPNYKREQIGNIIRKIAKEIV